MGRLLDEDAAIEALINKGQTSRRYKLGEFWELNGQEIREALNTVPSIQPEQKKGEWRLGFNSQYLEKYYYCSRCGKRKYEEYKPLDNFCSHCGADMRG